MYMLGTNALNIVLHIDGYTRLWFLCSSNKSKSNIWFYSDNKAGYSVMKYHYISLGISNKITWLC